MRGNGGGRTKIYVREKDRVSTTADTKPGIWDRGGKRKGSDGTHSLSRSYGECTGSFACTNWCCSSSMAASRRTARRTAWATGRMGDDVDV